MFSFSRSVRGGLLRLPAADACHLAKSSPVFAPFSGRHQRSRLRWIVTVANGSSLNLWVFQPRRARLWPWSPRSNPQWPGWSVL